MVLRFFRSRLFAAGVALVLAGLIGRLVLAPGDCRLLRIDFINRENDKVGANLWYHEDTLFPAPGIVLVHSFFQPPESIRPLALFLARRGLVVLELTLRPLTAEAKSRKLNDFTADIEAAVVYLSESGVSEEGRISLLGHSLGGNFAALCGTTIPNIPALVSLGFPAEGDAKSPRNLLLCAGAFDNLHPPWAMQQALSNATGGAERNPGGTTGSFKDGTARRLVISSYSDHAGENVDPFLMVEMTRWLSEAVPMEPRAWHFTEFLAPALTGAYYAGLVLLWIHLYLSVYRWSRNYEGAPILRNMVGALFTLVPIPVLGTLHYLISLGGYTPWSDFVRELLAFNIPGLLVANYIACNYSAMLRDLTFDPALLLMRPLKLCAVAWGCGLASSLVFTLPYLALHPAGLALVPLHVLSSLFDSLFLLGSSLQSLLVLQTDAPFMLTYLTCVLLALDLLLPGLVLIPIAGFLHSLLDGATSAVLFRPTLGSSRASVMLLLVLTATAWWTWRVVLGSDFRMSTEAVPSFAFILLRLLVPAALFIAALRSRWSVWGPKAAA